MPINNGKMKRKVQFVICLFTLIFLVSFPIAVSAKTTYDLVVQYVLATPQQGQAAYDVRIYLSILDADNELVKDLEEDDFVIKEDDQEINIDHFDVVDEPLEVMLLLDVSHPMAGSERLDDLKEAAKDYIDRLNRKDTVSVYSFNEKIITKFDFSDDHDAAKIEIDDLEADSESDTCLNEAMYEAVEYFATQSDSRRALIVFSARRDKMNDSDKECSNYTEDDVIDLATKRSGRVPIYTIGLGTAVDDNSLERISTRTGGRYRNAENSADLVDTFGEVTEELRNQYIIDYISNNTMGDHTILVKVDHKDITDTDSRDFSLPEASGGITLTSPQEGAEITGMVTLEASLSGTNTDIARVVFQINGNEIGSDDSSPYSIDYDFSETTAGNTSITVIARDADDKEVSKNSINVTVVAPNVEPTPPSTANTETNIEETTPIVENVESNPETSPSLPMNTLIILIVVGIGILGVAIIIAAVILSRKAKSDHGQPPMYNEPPSPPNTSPPMQPYVGDKTMDAFSIPAAMVKGVPAATVGKMGNLKIIASEDVMMIGQNVTITKSRTTIGRGADNDLVLPKDKAVSRQHAMIELQGNQLFLIEVVTQDPTGGVKRPTYGTYLNNIQVGSVPMALNTGDEIQLGTKFKMKFENLLSSSDSSAGATMDFDIGSLPKNRSDETMFMG